MKSVAKVATAVGIAGIMAVAAAAPAQADPWDGNYVDFGLGNWGYTSSDVSMDDVDLITDDDPFTTEYTDIWDGMGYTYIDSDDAGLNFEGVECDPDESVDVSVEASTGDLLYTCTASNAAFATAGVIVDSEIRVYSTSDLLRVTTFITNDSDVDLVIDGVEFYTDFGSDGEIWGYQGQDDAILPVPAAEDMASTIALYESGAQWAVHYNEDDAPGGVAWGHEAATAPATVNFIDGDEYSALVSDFTVPAGETRAVSYFALWNPALLIELGYTNDVANDVQIDAADALVPAMDEFNSFTGRLTAGLEGVSVVNWGPVAPAPAPVPVPEVPVLAATGTDTAGGIGIAGLLVVLGAGALALSLRRRSATN